MPCHNSTDGAMWICRPKRGFQPLTRFISIMPGLDEKSPDREKVVQYRRRAKFWCHDCRKRRIAANLEILDGGGWYDPMIRCTKDRGCRSVRERGHQRRLRREARQRRLARRSA